MSHPVTRVEGNVIHTDFGRRSMLDITLQTEILYFDELVILTRIAFLVNGRVERTDHFMLANMLHG